MKTTKTTTIDLIDYISSTDPKNPDQILFFKGRPRYVRTVAPTVMKRSMHCPSGGTSSVQISFAAKCLDPVFVSKSVNVIASYNEVYGELIESETTYRFLCDGKTICWEDKAPATHSFYLLPLVFYFLREETENPEFKDTFVKIRSIIEGERPEKELIQEVALFCDSINLHFVQKNRHIQVSEGCSNLIEDVQKKVNEGEFSPLTIVSGMRLPDLTGITIGNTATTNTEFDNEDFFNGMLNGDFRIPFDWSPEVRELIPSLSFLDNFVPTEEFYAMSNFVQYTLMDTLLELDTNAYNYAALMKKNAMNIETTGRPGSGKTTAIYALAAALGLPITSVALSKDTNDETFQGKHRIINGNLDCFPTEFNHIYENGGIIILEEFNLADQDAMQGGLGQAIEFPFSIDKKGIEKVNRHPLCVIFSTMNEGTNGSKPVNQAFSSRHPLTFPFKDPSEDDIVKMLASIPSHHKPRVKITTKHARWVCKAYNKVLGYLNAEGYEDMTLNITTRACKGALKLIEAGIPAKTALRYSVVGKVSETSLEVFDDVVDNLLEILSTL